MYGSGITPLAIGPTNQYGIGLYGVGPYGIHSLLHGLGPQLPGLGQPVGMPGLGQPWQFGMNPNMGQPGQPFNMLPGLGQPGGQLGQFGQPSPFGQPSSFGQPSPFGQLNQLGQLGQIGQIGQFGIAQPGPMMPTVGGRQVMRMYVPSIVGIVPIDVLV